MHVNDTFGTAMQKGIDARACRSSTCPTRSPRRSPTIRPRATSRSRSPRPRRPAPRRCCVVSRLNDAMLLTRELVKQRWTPMAVLSMGPGWYEDQYLKTLGKLADGPFSFVPWYDPNKPLSKQLEAALAKAHPGRQPQHQPHLHVRGAADRGRRLQAGRLRRPQGAGRRHPRDQHHQQRQHRPRHPVRRQGPERGPEERGHPEPRRQAGDGCAQGGRQRQGRVADERLRQARLKLLAPGPAPVAAEAGARAGRIVRCPPRSISTSPSAAC